MTEGEAQQFAREWIDAWNSQDLDAIVSFYAPNVVLISPLVVRVLDDPSCTVSGIEALRRYFGRGLEMRPSLAFKLLDVLCGVSSVLIYFEDDGAKRTGEFMELGPDGKVVRVVANKASQPLPLRLGIP